MAIPEPAARVAARSTHAAQRTTLIAARAPAAAAAAREAASGAVEARVRAAATGGAPLAPKTRAFLEPRFRANFSGVRIHTGPAAASLATAIGARAFTFGRHIFFNDGQYRPETRDGMALLAHELTHTIQQSEAIQRQADERAVRVSERTPPQASRLGLSDALDYFADAANAIPGYRMFTILIGVNPINMSPVEASAANILRAIVEFLPGGNLITRVLDSYGIFDRVGAWIEGQLRSLGISGSSIKAAIDRFLDSLSWSDIFDLGGVWRRARSIFTDPISRIISFARNLFGEIARMVREAVLRPLAALAEGTRGYPLLKAVLGEDPVTGEPFPRTAETVIGGFLTLIGQEELWQNIQRANAISRAWNWFQTAISSLVGLVRSIPGRFMAALRSLEVIDFIVLPRAFATLAATFGGFLADFGRWALGTVFDLLKIIVEVVAPGVMPYIQRAAGAFQTIVRNPVRFVQTLVRAAIQGFRQFASNFLTHLRASLIGWLTGAMAGANIYIPQGFNLREILKFVLSVLGLTWANIRAKLVRATSETVVVALETGFDIVRTLVTEGPAAAWQKILETLSNLRDMVIEQVMEFVRSRIVQAAVTRLLSMLSPAGALIQAIIAIYNTVMFFVERLRQIAQVAASFIDALATIAAGNIGPAANRVEQTMAGLLTLVISFLARIAGLGRVADAVTGIINRVRAPVDRAFDRVVAWIVAQARRLGRLVVGAARSVLNWFRERRQLRLGDGGTHTLSFRGTSERARLMLASEEKPVEEHLNEAIADPSLSNAAQGRARQALAFYSANLAPLSGRTIPNPAPQPLQDKLKDLPANLTEFANKLRAISADTNLDPPSATVPSWGGPAKATLDLVSNRGSRGGGDASSGQSPGWSILQTEGLTVGPTPWVRMHMVSAAYGGADHSGNLISAPGSVNTGGVVSGFEARVRQTLYGDANVSVVRTATRSSHRSLFKKLDAREAVVWLETTAAGRWPAQNNPAGVQICDGATFVRTVTFKAGIHYPREGAWAKDTTPLVTASVGIPKPDFSGVFQPNINTIGEGMISSLCGVPLRFARDIIRNRGGTPAGSPHGSRTNFTQRMRAQRTADGLELTPDYLAALNSVVAAASATPGRIKWR